MIWFFPRSCVKVRRALSCVGVGVGVSLQEIGFGFVGNKVLRRRDLYCGGGGEGFELCGYAIFLYCLWCVLFSGVCVSSAILVFVVLFVFCGGERISSVFVVVVACYL